ncbi:hypothetical protein A2U01_0110337, partial [Trifolium medium]|nr:hypothetical protein [Trifolium medium]
ARKTKEPQAQADDDETAHPAPKHHEGDPAQADAMEKGLSGDDRDNMMLEMEEERVREGDDGGPAKVRRPT